MPIAQTPWGAPGSGATAVISSSANQANANAVATLTATASQTAWITGFVATATGATAGLAVNITVAGILGGTLNFAFAFPAGVLVGAVPLVVEFPQPIPASAANVNIVVTLPASGAGGTNAAVVATGFLL
jgi:hypothetical protein